MGKTVFDETARRALLERAMRVHTGTKPRWGQFTAVKMLRHLSASFEMALGELPCAPKPGPMKNWFVHWLVIDSPLPWPKGTPTAPELLAQPTAGVEEEQQRLKTALERVVAHGPEGAFADHPAFGKLSSAQWGRLIWRHVDHHLRQFGV
ncbi:MAG TPA: DUF1569 domain-containing protein [Bryobacteraceae bacterium]|nr:DUF1569 domain-containing protein [Bryobacteraceae bacterium]